MNLTQADSYAGATDVKAGTLELANNSAIHNDANTTVESGATLMVLGGISANLHHLYISGTGANDTIGAHGALTCYGSFDTGSLGGPITLNDNSTVGVTATGAFTISGSISGPHGLTVGPEQGDGGSLVLSGHSTYTGRTVVDHGGLNVTGALASSVTVNGGHFGGTGSVGGLTFNGGTYDVTLSSPSSTGIHCTGSVNLGGATLNVFLNFAPSLDQQFQIIADGGRTSGSFASNTVTALYGTGTYTTYTFTASDDASGVKLTCTDIS
jgi:autotransporter-associated beta strand protein